MAPIQTLQFRFLPYREEIWQEPIWPDFQVSEQPFRHGPSTPVGHQQGFGIQSDDPNVRSLRFLEFSEF